jgi:hypothetical protein
LSLVFFFLKVMQNLLNRTLRIVALASLPAALFSVSIPDRPAVASEFDSCVTGLLAKNISGEAASVACGEALEPEALSSCTQKISEKANTPAEDALKACFRVRRPADLATCVVDIKEKAAKTYAAKPAEPPADVQTPAETPAEGQTPTEPPAGGQNKENSKDTEKVFSQNPPQPEQPEVAPAQPEAAPTETPQPTEETSTPSEGSNLLALDTCRRSLLPVRFSQCVIAVNNNVDGMTPENAIQSCIKAEDMPTELSSAEGMN